MAGRRWDVWAKRWFVAGGLGLALAPSAVPAVCPNDICDCLGAAGQFDVVVDEVAAKAGKVSFSGYGYRAGTLIGASVCATTGKLAGKAEGEAEIGEDLVLAATSGVAVMFKGYKDYGFANPGVRVDGDLLTGGGSISGSEYGLVAGTTDTSGTAPEVGDCAQAQADANVASATLAALPPTQSIAALALENQMSADINAGPGVNVIEIGSLVLKPAKVSGYVYGSFLNINLDELTESVIINVTGKFAIGTACEIIINGGDVEDVIINVAGKKPTLKIKEGAVVAPAILAPQRKILVGGQAVTANLYGRKATLKGTEISETLLCP